MRIVVLALAAAGGWPLQAASLVVAYDSEVAAYVEVYRGVASVAGAACRGVDVTQSSEINRLGPALSGGEADVVVAVGSRALRQVRSRSAEVPLVAALLDGGGELNDMDGAVDLDVPLGAQLAAIRMLFPERLRLGVIRNPARPRPALGALEGQARRLGFSLAVAEAAGPAQLLRALASLRGRIDILLCFPDADLYNAVTVKPLVLAALDDRVPIVGYSLAFVRAGAAAGVFADYFEAGRQAGEIALELARGEAAALEPAHRIRVAVNQRVVRLLGIPVRASALPVEVLR